MSIQRNTNSGMYFLMGEAQRGEVVSDYQLKIRTSSQWRNRK
jgi:hypothetical protein